MSDLELLVALAYTPLGVTIALPFVCLALSGLHHMWVHRVPVTSRTARMRARRKV